jgi:hypothetical protein
VWQTVDLIEELTKRNLFSEMGEQRCGPEAWQPTIEEYVLARHSQRSFSRTHMGQAAVEAFDAEIRELLEDLIAQDVIERVDGHLQLSVESTVTWGCPKLH